MFPKAGTRLKGALVVALAVLSIAAVTFVAQPKYNTTLIGTYWATSQRFDSTKGGGIGCRVEVYNAGDSEWVGDLTYLSAINTVKHDTVLANYNSIAGIVVGGQRLGMLSYADSTSVGTLAATSGQRVIICYDGRAWTTHDTTATTLPGTQIIPSNRQGQRGRYGSRTTAVDTFNRIFGKGLDTGLTARRTLVRITVR